MVEGRCAAGVLPDELLEYVGDSAPGRFASVVLGKRCRGAVEYRDPNVQLGEADVDAAVGEALHVGNDGGPNPLGLAYRVTGARREEFGQASIDVEVPASRARLVAFDSRP